MKRKKLKDSSKINKPKFGFDDVVGHKQVKERLKSIINMDTIRVKNSINNHITRKVHIKMKGKEHTGKWM